MQRFEHGGNVGGMGKVVDFSASLSPLGMPRSAREALVASVEACESYPDPASAELTEAIAAFEGVPAQWVLACAGATDALSRLCLAIRPHAALVCAPSYSGYEQAIEQAGGAVVRHNLYEHEGFELTQRIIGDVVAGIDMVFLANPNNPTGRCLAPGLLKRVLDVCRERRVVVVLDECFIDLTEQPGSQHMLGDNQNLVIVKALTKTFAMAGLRVGYALCANASMIAALRDAGQPWAVSAPAQVAGVAALSQKGYVQHAREMVALERAHLASALVACGMDVVDGQANYLMFKSPMPLYNPLRDRGIVIRRCDNFHQLDGSWYRIAVRTPTENQQFVAALQEVCR